MRLITSILLFFVLKATSVFAMSLDWSGNYRVEWTQVDKPSLGQPSERKAYGVQYLALDSKIVASDGYYLLGRLNILNNRTSAYSNSQAGQIFGAGGTAASTALDSLPVQLSYLYLQATQEYGSLLLGRAPLQFGLGISFNAGNGPFDHWFNSRDIAAYKFVIGNFYFMPALARVRDIDYWQGNFVQEEILEVGYNAPESNSQIAFMITKRKGSDTVNDIDTTKIVQLPLTATKVGGFAINRTNVLLTKEWSTFGFKVEGSFLTGDTGMQASNGDMIEFNGYGIATEWYFPRKGSSMEWSLKAGVATGDDPATSDYEGFQFDRNYDVAFLLFNHRLGRADFMTSNLIKETSTLTVGNSIDDEVIGNAFYITPVLKYIWNDKLDIVGSLTYAQTMASPTGASGYSNNLGAELDVDAVYKPRQKIIWSNRLGMFFPGKAFSNGTNNYSTDSVLGFESRLAISF